MGMNKLICDMAQDGTPKYTNIKNLQRKEELEKEKEKELWIKRETPRVQYHRGQVTQRICPVYSTNTVCTTMKLDTFKIVCDTIVNETVKSFAS